MPQVSLLTKISQLTVRNRFDLILAKIILSSDKAVEILACRRKKPQGNKYKYKASLPYLIMFLITFVPLRITTVPASPEYYKKGGTNCCNH